MIIGLISDTHDNIPNILKALNLFRKHHVEIVLHAGDICAPVTINYFKGFKVKFCRGNVDGDVELMEKKAAEIGGDFYDDIGIFTLAGKRFALYHGKNEVTLDGLIQSKKYDYVITGHKHVKRDDTIGDTRVINPGGHYLAPNQKPHTVAILDTEKDIVEFFEIK